MHPLLREVYEATLAVFRDDPRVLSAYATGSMCSEREDEYSDVDLDVVVPSEAFDAFDADLPAVFARLGVEPVVWLPERCSPAFRNYAILFERHGEFLHYDISVHAALPDLPVPVPSDRLIFDKTGIAPLGPPRGSVGYSPERLRPLIEAYWIYVHIHAKHLLRGDLFRLLAAQQELLHCHIGVLRALRPETPSDWWPIMAREASDTEEKEDALLDYLGHRDVEGVSGALLAQAERFDRHAREACRRWHVDYPVDLATRALGSARRAIDEVGTA